MEKKYNIKDIESIIDELGLEDKERVELSSIINKNKNNFKNLKESSMEEGIGSAIPIRFYTLVGTMIANAVNNETLVEFIEDGEHTAHHLELIGHFTHILFENMDSIEEIVKAII